MAETQLGILRIHITGRWTVQEMSNLFASINTSYVRLNAFLYLSDSFDKRIRSLNPRRYYDDGPHPYRVPVVLLDSDFPAWAEALITSAQLEGSELLVQGIELHSPGWLDVLGRLNPLRTLQEIIKDWRSENTKRMRLDLDRAKMKSQERSEIRQLESHERLEKLRIQSDVFKTIVDRGEQLRRDGSSPLLDRFIDWTASQPIREIEEIAKDTRIEDAEILDDGGAPAGTRESH